MTKKNKINISIEENTVNTKVDDRIINIESSLDILAQDIMYHLHSIETAVNQIDYDLYDETYMDPTEADSEKMPGGLYKKLVYIKSRIEQCEAAVNHITKRIKEQ